MFKLAPSDRFTYPVTVETIVNGGATRKDKFSVTFARLSTTEVTDWVDRIIEAGREGTETAVQTARDLAHKVVLDWQEVLGDDGTPVPFSTDMLSQALEIHPFPTSIASAWLEAVNGGAKRKN